MANEKKTQFSLTWLMRVSVGLLVVVSVGIFANSAMRYNALLEEQRKLEEQLADYREKKEELQELIASGADEDVIIKFAKEYLGLYFPDVQIFYNSRNE